jgi:hypothetical protein
MVVTPTMPVRINQIANASIPALRVTRTAMLCLQQYGNRRAAPGASQICEDPSCTSAPILATVVVKRKRSVGHESAA